MIIAVDFDGTIAEHKFPDIGNPVPGAFHWLKKFREAGAGIILWTMRSDGQKHGPTLTQAVEFCRKHGIEFDGINENPTQKTWTCSPKAYAHIYIDDAAFGCPLVDSKEMGARMMVDWSKVGPAIMEQMEREAA